MLTDTTMKKHTKNGLINYSQYSSIYQAVGLEEPEIGICGPGTESVNGVCQVIKAENLRERRWRLPNCNSS
ncbi:MAG: hypothetical protein CM1200mP11_0250 [Nitrosopumilaceae archaeon]|nr:MAG: hypothetical protein CM1200mP11_0250 [Nitrosopumilaceae archaeon]